MESKEQYLISALERFKDMIITGECSKQDIAYFCGLSKYELERRCATSEKQWLTKEEASKELGISTSTFDRIVAKGGIAKGKKIRNHKALLWKREQVEQLKTLILLKGKH